VHESELTNLTKNEYLIHPRFQSTFAYETEKFGSGDLAVVGLITDKRKPVCALLRRAHIKNGLLDVQYGILPLKDQGRATELFFPKRLWFAKGT
jgi:hypothetical protein